MLYVIYLISIALLSILALLGTYIASTILSPKGPSTIPMLSVALMVIFVVAITVWFPGYKDEPYQYKIEYTIGSDNMELYCTDMLDVASISILLNEYPIVSTCTIFYDNYNRLYFNNNWKAIKTTRKENSPCDESSNKPVTM